MASLLNTNKFVRYFSAASKSFTSRSFNTTNALFTTNNVLQENVSTSMKNQCLQPLLEDIQSDVIKYGRITKTNLDKILQQIKNANEITNLQSLQIIRCCGRIASEEPAEMRTSLANNIWISLKDKGFPMDVSHYNTLLRVYIENEHPFSPKTFLEEMKERGLLPNRVTFERIMWRYCQDGDIEQARKVLEKVREHNMNMSEALFNALVVGHIVQGDIKAAHAVLQEMAVASINPSHRTYGLLACGHAKNGDINEIENILNIAMIKDIVMTNRDLFNIIENLAIGYHEDKIEQIFPYLHVETGYEMDVYSFIFKLLDKGFESTARKVWKSMTIINFPAQNGQKIKWAYVKKIIESDLPINKVIQTLRELQNEDLIPNAIDIASGTSLSMGKSELALKLFDELEKDGLEIREHYYWPLLAQKILEKDEAELLELVRKMCYKNLMPSEESLRNYIIPYLLQKNTPQSIIDKLEFINVPSFHTAFNLMIYFLELGDVNSAKNVAMNCVQTNKEPIIAQILSTGQDQTENIHLFINLLHFIISTSRENKYNNIDHQDYIQKMSDAINKLIIMLNNQVLVEQILAFALSNDVKIDSTTGDKIKQFLGDEMNQEASKLLKLISLADLKETISCQTEPKIESLVKQSISNTESPENNIKKAYMLINTFRYDEAIQLLQNNKCSNPENIDYIKSTSWYMLNTLADRKCEEKVKEITEILIANSYVEPSTVTLGALIKVQIIKGNIDGALKEFERCCLDYKMAPWSCRLMKILIMNEEAAKLQWLMDLIIKIRDEESTLRDLICMYVECNRPADARNIIIDPALRDKIDMLLNTVCRRYAELGESKHLQIMLQATKMVTCVNRQEIFYYLLLLYCEGNETDKAFDLWVRMQDEDETPSEQFLTLLGNQLLKNKREVPFAMPLNKLSVNRKVEKLSSKSKKISYETIFTNLKHLINDLEAAKTYKEAKNASHKFFKGIAVNKVVQNQEMLGLYQKIAELAASHGYKLPAILLWQELLLAGKHTEANIIFQQHLYASHSVILGPAIEIVLKRCQQRRQPDIIKNLIDILQGVPRIVRENIGLAYSTLINMYLDDDKVGNAKACLKLAYKNGITEDYLDSDTMTRVTKLNIKNETKL